MDERTYKTFYGSRSSNTCAFCYKHYLSMTPQQIKQRGCLQKQCGALERIEHPYWTERAEKKSKRVARKARLDRLYKEVTS